MSINMLLHSAHNQSEIIKSICENIYKDMKTLKKGLFAFINEDSLKGESYDSAKKYLNNTYIPLIHGFLLLSEEIIQTQDKFISQYKSNVDVNSLQSEVLENQIYRINQIIYELESIIPYNSVIRLGITNMISNYQYQKKKVEEKLEKLINFNNTSIDIFSEIETLLNDIKEGILEISNTDHWNSINNLFTSDISRSQWISNLNDKYYKKELDLILKKAPNLTEEDLMKIKEYERNYNDKDIPKNILDTLKAIDKTIESASSLVTKNLILKEAQASIQKIKNKTWYRAPVKSTKSGYKTWKQVSGDVKRFKSVKNIKKMDQFYNGTGTLKINNVTKITPKNIAKSVGVLGGISAVLDGGITYLERKDKYGNVSAVIDGVGHSAISVGAIYAGATIGSAIPIPVVGTIAGAFVGAIVGNVFKSIWDGIFH